MNVYLSSVVVRAVAAYRGIARGIDIFNGAENVHLCAANTIRNVSAATEDADGVLVGDFATGPKVPAAQGLHIDGSAARGTFGAGGVDVDDVLSGAFDQAHLKTIGSEVELADVEIVHANSYEL